MFCKSMARVLMPPNGEQPSIASSLLTGEDLGCISQGSNGTTRSPPYIYTPHLTEPLNPRVLPARILRHVHFTFLIRHPCLSVPSNYRLSSPPLSYKTGWHGYRPKDAGYSKFRRFFDYFREIGQIGPKVATHDNEHVSDEAVASESALEICLIDIDELLDHPAAVTEAYCRSVGLTYNGSMLSWGKPEDRQKAESEFGTRMRPWHEVAIDSTGLKPRNKIYS